MGGKKRVQEPLQVLASSAALCCRPGAGFARNLPLSPVSNQAVNLLVPSTVMANAGLWIKRALIRAPTRGEEILFL